MISKFTASFKFEFILDFVLFSTTKTESKEIII